MSRLGSPSARGTAAASPPRDRPLSPVVLGLLVVLSVWAVLYELACTAAPGLLHALPWTGIAPDIAFGLGGLLAILRSFRAERGWVLIGLGALCWASGDVYWQLKLAHMSSPPVPSWADAGYLSFCPLTFIGILWLIRTRVSGAPKTLVADALAASLAVGALSAAIVVQPILANAQGGTLAIATNLAYPTFDVLLMGLIVGATALSGWRIQRTWALLGLSVVSFWVADSFYLVTVATGTYQLSAWFNPLWYFSPIIAAWAAWLPRRSAAAALTRREGTRGIVMSLVFACTALGTLVWSSFSSLGTIAVVLATMSLQVIMFRLLLTWRENAALLRTSQEEALTDALTGLPNRRALALELERRMARAEQLPYVLALFDLDGFKHYNDSYGHPTGDALLQRLGSKLQSELGRKGTVYRMGGDEFCALIDDLDAPDASVQGAAAALTEHGDGFTIGCSYGSILLPSEAQTSEAALRLADQRMYAQKRGARASASRQSADVLLRALAERNQELGSHLRDVAELACAVAGRLGLPQEEIENIRQAAELHDLGKVAIPDAILFKPGPLTDSEWAFIRRHTVIGERIAGAAPALRRVAKIVRSTHENVDGTGYPDGLVGEEIPLGSRIIFVCDAFDAMTSERTYCAAKGEAAALEELRRCAGTQFDARVVEQFCEVVRESWAYRQAA